MPVETIVTIYNVEAAFGKLGEGEIEEGAGEDVYSMAFIDSETNTSYRILFNESKVKDYLERSLASLAGVEVPARPKLVIPRGRVR